MNNIAKKAYYANGNLIISGEYFVILGGLSLAVPLRFGQTLQVEQGEGDKNTISLNAYIMNKPWLSAEFGRDNFDIIRTSNVTGIQLIRKILVAAKEIKPGFPDQEGHLIMRTNTEFSTAWGWGSSAALIANIAHWSGTDPFILHRHVSNGSGYDIAAALSFSPVLYSNRNGDPVIRPVIFDPPFSDRIFFVYLGKKVNSEKNIQLHMGKLVHYKKLLPTMGEITKKFVYEKDINRYMYLMREHESLISDVIQTQPVKNELFGDFKGEIKSLGAWGGDFVMAVSHEPDTYVNRYFRNKNMNVIYRFSDLIGQKTYGEHKTKAGKSFIEPLHFLYP